jgi:hypothetical protein
MWQCMRSTNKKIDSKNLHAKKSIFGINVEISKTNAKKWNTNIEKMEYNFGTQLDHGEDKEK